MANLKVEPLLDQHLKPIKSGDETTPLNISTEKVTYAKEPTENYELVNKKYADKHYWQTRMLGGYKTNNNSSSLYYTNVDASDSRWTDSDSSPTAVDVSMGTKTPFFVCVKNGVITNFYMTGYAGDTAWDDPFRFYIYTGIPVNDASSTILTQIYQSSRITPLSSVGNIIFDEVVEALISESQRLYCFLKKDSTSGNQDLNFSITISGYYTE